MGGGNNKQNKTSAPERQTEITRGMKRRSEQEAQLKELNFLIFFWGAKTLTWRGEGLLEQT